MVFGELQPYGNVFGQRFVRPEKGKQPPYRIGRKTVFFFQPDQFFQFVETGRVGQPIAENVVFKHKLQGLGGLRRQQNLDQFVADSFHRQVF